MTCPPGSAGCALARAAVVCSLLATMVAGPMMICMRRGERTGEGSAEQPGEAPTWRSDRMARRVISSRSRELDESTDEWARAL